MSRPELNVQGPAAIAPGAADERYADQVPTDCPPEFAHLWMRDLAPYCAARNRYWGPCLNPKGKGTNHLGQGKCYIHGGKTPITHGRYSTIERPRIRELVAQYEADEDPLDLLPDLAMARALLVDFVERYDEWRAALVAWHESFEGDDGPKRPRQVLDVADAHKLVRTVSDTWYKIRSIQEKGAVSRSELQRIMQCMGRAVETHVKDAAVVDKILESWLEIRL